MINIMYTVDPIKRIVKPMSGHAVTEQDHEASSLRFAFPDNIAGTGLESTGTAVRVMYIRPDGGDPVAKTLTFYKHSGGYYLYDWNLQKSDLQKEGRLVFSLCILDISGGEVSEWHTTPCAVRVLDTIHTDDSDEADETITPTVAERVAVLESMIQRVASGAPIVVASTSAMTDTSRIYVLTTDSKWYYYDGSAWVAGGEYGGVANGSVTTDKLADGAVETAKIADGAITSEKIASGAVPTDTTLSQSGISADAKAVGDKIADLKSAFDDLFFSTIDVTGQLVNGYYVTDQATGTIVPTTILSRDAGRCGIFACKKGDVFTITGKGGSSNRTWAFTDSDYKMLSKAGGSAQVTELSLIASQDGYFFFNSEANKNPSVKYTSYVYVTDKTLTEANVPADAKATRDAIKSIGKITVTDPKQIPWFFGEMSASGTIKYNLNGVVTLYPVRVYAGSVIGTKNSTIEFNARFTFDDGTTYYKALNSNGYTVNKDGRVLIRVGLSSGASIHNISLLDNLNISLVCDNDLISKFLRTDVMLGHIPANDYVGRHADTSGFSQTTDYATAIQPWRDFAANNSGYITESDFGAIYENGPHQYRYTLNPPNRSVSGKKLARVFVVTSQHGHEKSATYGMSYLIKDMLEHSLEDPVLFYLRNYVRFTVLPIANPHGWDANSSLGTHGGIRQNENGVNLNRNFGVSAWANYDDDPDYTTPREYNYRGVAPFSEIETQNIRNAIVASHGDISLMIDIHTYGTDTTNAVSITFVGANKDSDGVMKKIYDSFDQYLCGVKNHMDALYGVNLGLSQVYGSSTLDSVVNMTMQDYGYDAVQVPSVTLEVPCGATNGFLGNKLSKYSADLIKLCGEMIGNFIVKALYYIHEQ